MSTPKQKWRYKFIFFSLIKHKLMLYLHLHLNYNFVFYSSNFTYPKLRFGELLCEFSAITRYQELVQNQFQMVFEPEYHAGSFHRKKL